METASLLPVGLLPPPGLFAVLCWPFLVAVLLWASGRIGQGRGLALAGAAMSLFALVFFPNNLPIVQTVAIGLESCTPLLLFVSAPLVNAPSGGQVELTRAEAALAERLPFLVTGCGLMALCVQSVLAVVICLGAGAVVLAWWDGRGPRRARSAWDMVRLRLCGVCLSALGAALLQALPLTPDSQDGATLGAIMLVVGLGMMAGLGETNILVPAFALLETGLRFGALFLLLQLAVSPLTRELILLAGLAGLWLTVLGSGRRSAPLLSLLVGLGAVAAGSGQENALLILFCAALLCCALQRLLAPLSIETGNAKVGGTQLVEWCALPLLVVILIMLAQVLSWVMTVLAVGALAWDLRTLTLQGLSLSWLGARMAAPDRRLALGLGVGLLALALTAAFVPGSSEIPGEEEDPDVSGRLILSPLPESLRSPAVLGEREA
ncbi:hypothetical protein [Oecophyllibacter saccharovorans]|uniref:hypothetical protein n=1 Tax=Oecophyllibacter saccharovorans TaxID=2558360 RepID=UPI001141886C|nr:hypothetical protein [Oecophyllibacter saccharovorans]QDH14745.1 hypothetical protein E3E11_01470 [Oecophyllibacter saccharovorans]TPW34944.1 hypothetical protein E3203_05450 [Oecophyllibacter saccharovorans]